MKKIFLLLLFLIFPTFVNAEVWTNKKPTYTSVSTADGGYQETQVTYETNKWGDINGWQSPYYYDSGYTKNITWRYDGAPFLGKDWKVKAQIFTTTEEGASFFRDVPYSIYILTDYGTEPCVVEAGGYSGRSGNYTSFECSGSSTNRFQIVLNFGESSRNSTYFMLRSDWSQITTDISNGSLLGEIDSSINDSANNIIDNQNKNQQETNEKLDGINDSITSEEPPNLSGLENSAGWLPAGPVDSILNLPLSFFDNLSANMGKTCQPISFTLPFVKQEITLPCINTIYSQIDGLTPWIETISALISSLILFKYLINLYKWVDDTLSFRENNWNDTDQWGGL